MILRTVAAILAAAACLPAAPKKTSGDGRGENQDVLLKITLHTDPASVKELVGDDLGGHFIVAVVKFQSKYGKDIQVDRDDFVLRTDKDGEKTQPFAPSQIAGRGALVITQTGRGGGVGAEQGGPIIGGIPGTMGRPQQLPGSGGSVGSSSGGEAGVSEAKVDNGNREKDNPLLKVLKDKMLPEKKTDAAVEGLLYFPMEKQKLKDLELTYGNRENRITMRFK